MMVISAPLRQGLKPVTTVLAAPIKKWASVLITKDEIIAVYPSAKKKGMIGINAPAAVDRLAETAATQGLGKVSSERPSSSLPRVFKAVSG